jgi:hypothetical protein
MKFPFLVTMSKSARKSLVSPSKNGEARTLSIASLQPTMPSHSFSLAFNRLRRSLLNT